MLDKAEAGAVMRDGGGAAETRRVRSCRELSGPHPVPLGITPPRHNVAVELPRGAELLGLTERQSSHTPVENAALSGTR